MVTSSTDLLSLREYQRNAVTRLHVAFAEHSRVVLQAATGCGKTTIGAAFIRDFLAVAPIADDERDDPTEPTPPRAVLWIAHRRELIDQAYARFLSFGMPAGTILASDRKRVDAEARIQVASIDTLRRRKLPAADLVIVDEAHRAISTGYTAVREAYPDAYHLGLTATPERLDGRGLCRAYDAIVSAVPMSELIRDGWLAAPIVYSHPRKPDLAGVQTVAGDYNPAQLASVMESHELVGDVVAHWMLLANGQRTVVFATSITHSRMIVNAFVAAGIAAEHLDGETPLGERADILLRLDAGVTRVVSNVGVLLEGWDQPAVRCIVHARPTKSLTLWLQSVGRCMRPWRDPVTGENASPVVLDHAGNALMHGLPSTDREWSLDEKRRKRTVDTRTCEACFAIFALAEWPYARPHCPACGMRICKRCGASFDVAAWPVGAYCPNGCEKPAPKPTEHVAGMLAIVGEPARPAVDALIDPRHAFYATALAEARRKNWKLSAASMRYKGKFGEWPPWDWIPAEERMRIREARRGER